MDSGCVGVVFDEGAGMKEFRLLGVLRVKVSSRFFVFLGGMSRR